MKCDLCIQLFSVRCIITFRALFFLNCQFLRGKVKTYPLTRRRKSQTKRPISLPIAHPKKLAHGSNWRGTAPFAALLSISTLISKLWALFKILIFSLDCPFNFATPGLDKWQSRLRHVSASQSQRVGCGSTNDKIVESIPVAVPVHDTAYASVFALNVQQRLRHLCWWCVEGLKANALQRALYGCAYWISGARRRWHTEYELVRRYARVVVDFMVRQHVAPAEVVLNEEDGIVRMRPDCCLLMLVFIRFFACLLHQQAAIMRTDRCRSYYSIVAAPDRSRRRLH